MHKDNKDDLRKLFVGLDKKVNVEDYSYKL